MKIEHIAIWTDDIEGLRNYYTKYFEGIPNEKYINKHNRFQSYFLTFKTGARLEIMSMPNIPDNANDTVISQHKGIIHLAFGVETIKDVEEKASQLRADDFPILSGPRITGDGYFEFETLDPDSNRLEVTTKL
ncbi:MAG: VOC family protein [Saprospiraceae bacterium]|jgi:lactoylglutathione lyase|nr:VOC family protein [Saprospiraceae bacterium]